jgi:GNAT superfamily N-acetyltransferase
LPAFIAVMLIRPANIDDAAAISIVHIDTWKTTYKGMVPDYIIDGLDYVKNNERWRQTLSQENGKRTFAAISDDGRIIGFTSAGPNRNDQYKFSGELYAIYILKKYQGQGIGKALVVEAMEWLISNGYNSMIVWVLKDNLAKYFYEALGGKYVNTEKVEIGNVFIDEISYGWNDLREFLESNRR